MIFTLFCLESFCAKAGQPFFENDKLSLSAFAKENGEKTRFLICFTLKDGWHISYQNPGDAGVATKFDFTNTQAILLNQSAPQKFLFEDIITQYGYGDKACYLFELSDIKPDAKVNVSWTACNDYCEPEEVQIPLNVASFDFEETVFTSAETTFPRRLREKVIVLQKGDYLILSTKANLEDDTYFISTEADVFNADAPQILKKDGHQSVLKIKTDYLNKLPLNGLFISKSKAYQFEILSKKPNLLWVLFIAFCAGMLLNLMPCVFPVLSFKAIQMARDLRYKKGRLARAFFYTLGVVSSFLSVAGILYLLKSTGAALGWGFQLQSPVFVSAMLILFVLILLQSLEIFKIKLPFLDKMHRASTLNSFLTGFFAVLIASPCTGPFMGAAIGYALFESAEIYFPVFFALSLGYALPFALLEVFPAVIRKIMPKPGRWMRYVKYGLSLPIALTVLWLGWVLYHQLNFKPQKDLWLPYSQESVDAALSNGQAVFIDFTAKWCLTCLLNEQTVLSSQNFSDAVKTQNIKLFKADWTMRDETIFSALKTYGRSSVPLYVFYPQNSENYVILPTLLTSEKLFNALQNNQ